MPYGTVNADSLVSSDGGVISPNINSLRNRIINGAMVIDQRNAGGVITTPNGAFPVDRFSVTQYIATTTTQQSTTAPSGYSNSLLVTNGTAASPSASFNYRVFQNIEGFNTVDLVFGTASASTITISFWVRSSLTGTFAVAIQNSAQNRSYVSTYTINSANTFEQKTITIAGDTSGTWIGATNGIGLRLIFDLGSGTDYNTTANAWQAGNYTKTSGCVAFNNTTSATFYITGVQLEKGSVATSFDYRPYGTELALCQRYYQFIGGTTNSFPLIGGYIGNGETLRSPMIFPVQMRAAPTITKNGTWTAVGIGQPTANYINNQGFSIEAVGTSGGYYMHPNSTDDNFTMSAEL